MLTWLDQNVMSPLATRSSYTRLVTIKCEWASLIAHTCFPCYHAEGVSMNMNVFEAHV